MKVRCTKLLDSTGMPAEHSAWLRIGGVYHMLSVWIEPGQTKVRLVGEEPTPALFVLEMFEIVSSALPVTWVIIAPKPRCLLLAPEAWSGADFWERFFNQEAQARVSFEQERRRIIASDP